MREEIERFCNDIKVEYCLFLYEKGDDISFPYCCRLSADLITSYLKMVCSEKFQYIGTTNRKLYNHAWTLYDDGEENFIIDFTHLQYTNEKNARRMKEHKFLNFDFEKIIKMEKVVFNSKEICMYGCDEYMYPKKQKCYGIINGFRGQMCKDNFFLYLKKSYNVVYSNTEYY